MVHSLSHFPLLHFPKAAAVPSAQTLEITDFSFSDLALSDLDTALCTIRMFTDLNLVQNFQMKHEVGVPCQPPGVGTRVCACVRAREFVLMPVWDRDF